MLYMESDSTNNGSYTLTVTFQVGTDPDLAQVNVQNRVEPLLRGVGFARHARRFGQALQPRDLAVGCGAGAVHRLFDRAEGRLTGLPDLLEGALDLRLPLNAKADGDIRGAHDGSAFRR